MASPVEISSPTPDEHVEPNQYAFHIYNGNIAMLYTKCDVRTNEKKAIARYFLFPLCIYLHESLYVVAMSAMLQILLFFNIVAYNILWYVLVHTIS